MTINQILILESNDFFYHATYKPLLKKIFREGLNPNILKKSWKGSGNFIYLSKDPHVAESYAETSMDVPDDYIDNVVILIIDAKMLDNNFLSIDSNNKAGDTYQYSKTIPKEAIRIS